MKIRSARRILAALAACLFLAAAAWAAGENAEAAPPFRYAVTQGRYDDKTAMRGVLEEFGQEAQMADWNEVKALYGQDITAFLQGAGVQTDVDVWVRRGGAEYSGSRHYFLARISSPRRNFLLHDKIGNTAWLGSWYGIRMPVLVKLPDDGPGATGTPGQEGQATPAPTDPAAAIRLLLVGNWRDAGIGGMMYTDYAEFYADGTCTGYAVGPGGPSIDAANYRDMSLYAEIRHGTWHADAYDPALDLFWDNSVPYILTITGDDGRADRFGLSFNGADTMTFLSAEGAGGYLRVGPRQEPTPTPAGPDAALRQYLAGNWTDAQIGGLMYTNYIEFYADGTCAGYGTSPDKAFSDVSDYWDMSLADDFLRGTWHAGAYDPALGLFWDNSVPYILTITGDDGTVRQYGVRLNGPDSMTFITSEGGGGYIRADPRPGI